MSRLIYLCAPHGAKLPVRAEDIEKLSARLTPDNITPNPPHIIERDGILIGVINPVDSLPVVGISVCLGMLFGENGDWWRPGAEAPDGSYALFRGDAEHVELVNDMAASRTIWYVLTEALFIASTSQRAIVSLLGTFEANEAVYPWMISSGTLGPGFSWDRRIRCVSGDTRLVLDRASWSLKSIRRPVAYVPQPMSDQEHEEHLRYAIEDTFSRFKPDLEKWMLLLSGGYDSRANLLMLKNRPGLKTITWGVKSALDDRRSDAWVARELARQAGLAHEYFTLDTSAEPIERIFDRFLTAGEGRVDHISGYMDGFAVWKHLFESGCHGVIRGDETLGCKSVHHPMDVYTNMSLVTLSDFSNLGAAERILRACGQSRPASLERQPGETVEVWRDRLNTEFEVPVIMAALNDLKTAYTEITNPLLSRRIIAQVRSLPDHLRTDKTAFKRVVRNLGTDTPFASSRAIGLRQNILGCEAVVSVIYDCLSTATSQTGHIADLARLGLSVLDSSSAKPSPLNGRMKKLLALVLRRAGVSMGKVAMDPYVFAFRIYLLVRMTEILRRDAGVRRSVAEESQPANVASLR